MQNKKIVFALLAVTLMLTCVVLSGGCGGGGINSSSSNENVQERPRQYVMLGTVDEKRVEELKGSNLYPIILDYISGKTSASLKNSAADNVDIGALTNRDVLLLPDTSNLETMDELTLASVQEAYLYQDVPLVALYPDSKDISVMSEFISVTMVPPVSNDGVTPLTNPYYEYMAVAHRFMRR